MSEIKTNIDSKNLQPTTVNDNTFVDNKKNNNFNEGFFKNFDTFKIAHIGLELIVIGGVYWTLNKKITQLQNDNLKLIETIETLKTNNANNNISEDTLNKINYLTENLDNILQANVNNSKHFQNIYNIIKNLDVQQKMLVKNNLHTENKKSTTSDIFKNESDTRREPTGFFKSQSDNFTEGVFKEPGIINDSAGILNIVLEKPLDILTGNIKPKSKLNAIEITEINDIEPTPPDVLDAELAEDDEPEITTTQPPKKK